MRRGFKLVATAVERTKLPEVIRTVTPGDRVVNLKDQAVVDEVEYRAMDIRYGPGNP